ncbi:NYN domain-containing protein [Thermoflavimicrobium daqui]|uniref:RNA-binding protein n=1 Tax=Thermoflavimicrobium daqui TaxID=2137476 RepID=A0A364K318_9BACL|nr:NYN domain-containing protein [Thermoflavimicrobium daqui]RAL23230.1 RNA-binding protein [Thermoflavimicrobium daqui]
MNKLEEWLVVDGYNVIGSNTGTDRSIHWNPSQLEEERIKLIRDLSEYQAASGRRVFLVFDAHRTAGKEVVEEQEKITVYYTRYGETADELIERFVKKYKSPHRRIFVATSDYLEQRMVFGQGAYRISSRELLQEIRLGKQKLSDRLRKKGNINITSGNALEERLSDEIRNKLEKWRRKN